MSSKQSPQPDETNFDGLWLCAKAWPDDQGNVLSSALLFARGNGKLFLVRFNHSGGEGGVTIPFMWDYHVLPGIIREHPLTYPEKTRFDVPWQAEPDGSLTLHYRRGPDRFYPAKWDDLFALGFEQSEIDETLSEIEGAGWTYVLEPRIPML